MTDEGLANHTNIQWNGHVGNVEYGGGAKGQVAMFYYRPIHQPGKSLEEGRPVFDDVVYVRIHPPGERLNIIDRPASGADARMWPQQWQQFQQNKQQQPSGTPIEMLYPEVPSVAAMLRANGVCTIEQCADLSGPAIDNIGMGAQRYVNDSAKYIQMSEKNVKAGQFRHEMEEKDREIKLLTRQVEDLKSAVEESQANARAQSGMAQAMISAATGAAARPTHPGPYPLPRPAGDPQLAMLNATHPSRAQRQQKPKGRSRPRLG